MWNYRVTVDRSALPQYAIREVYYREDGSIEGWTVDPRDLTGESIEDIKADLELIQSAFSKPVIDITDEDNPKELT